MCDYFNSRDLALVVSSIAYATFVALTKSPPFYVFKNCFI